MAGAFDPYHRWLSIPPAEQPPNHYRLLGLQPFERNIDVIKSAAKRQAAHVRLFLDSPMRPYAVNVIRELDTASKCLLDADAKAAYDAWLGDRVKFPRHVALTEAGPEGSEHAGPTRRESVSTATATHPVRSVGAVEGPSSNVAARNERDVAFASPLGSAQLPGVVITPRRRRRSRNNSPLTITVFWLLGGFIGLLAGYAVLCLIDPKYDFLNVMFRGTQDSQGPQVATIVADDSEGAFAESSRSSPKTRSVDIPNRLDRKKPSTSVERPNRDLATVPEVELEKTAPQRPQPRTRLKIQVPSVLPLPPTELTDTSLMFASLPPGINFYSAEYQLRLSLTQGSYQTDGRLHVTIDDASDVAERIWVVRWIPAVSDLTRIGDIATSDVGTFSALENEIRFSWATNLDGTAVSAIRNSMLTIQIGESEQTVALRAPENLPPMTIDLRRPKCQLIYNIDDPPRIDDIRFDMTDPSALPLYRTEGTGLRGLRVDDVTTLWYHEASGAASRLSVIKNRGRPAVQIESYYRLPSGYEGPLTITRARNKMQELHDKLASAQAFKARSPQTRQDSVNSAIAEFTLDIHALERVGKLAEKLHDARVPFRAYIDVEGHRVELAASN